MTTPDTRSSQWLKSNLAALGSAAVLTVYVAGWARTKAAADLLDEQSERAMPLRRPAARATVGNVDGAVVPRTPTQPEATPTVVAAPAPLSKASADTAAARTEANSSAQSTAVKSAAAPAASVIAAAPPVSTPTTAAVKPVAPGATTSTPVAAPSASVVAPATTTPAPPASQPTPTAPTQDPNIVPGAPRELATNAQATAPASKGDAPSAPSAYKDGLYSGWGTSRHSDIEAYVEIKGGKITSAFIGECLTQYSCSWIAKLPPMVIEAQSAEIDYISGATHSSNAFYYAVANALKKAQAR